MNRIIILLTILFCLSVSNTFSQKPPDGNTNECSPHENFEELIDHLENGGDYGVDVQITYVNPPKERSNLNAFPSHYYSSYGSRAVVYDNVNCRLTVNQMPTLFSDRNLYQGNKDIVSYVFDMNSNEVEVTLNTWGNGKNTYGDIQRHGDLILYVLRDNGGITIFNFAKVINLR